VRDHERAAGEVEDVELDEVDAVGDGRPEGAQRVLRLDGSGAAMTDPKRPPVSAGELDAGRDARQAQRPKRS
jgi:hypothetical protein